MQNNWLRLVRGCLVIRLGGDYIERFINMCRMHDIFLWDIKKEEKDIIIVTDGGKAISLSTALIPEKATRTSQGVTIFQIKSDNKAIFVSDKLEKYASAGKSYKKIKLPATGVPMADGDIKNLPETVALKLK